MIIVNLQYLCIEYTGILCMAEGGNFFTAHIKFTFRFAVTSLLLSNF